MARKRYTEEQIIAVLKEGEAGTKVAELCRKHGISSPTFYKWKSKYGGLSASELKRMKELEQELSQYKKMYAELARDNYVLSKIIEKKL